LNKWSEIHFDKILPKLPPNFKDLNLNKLPNNDDISFEEIKSLNDDFIVKFTEFINSDNDIFYLSCSFPLIFNNVINETMHKNSQLLLGKKSESGVLNNSYSNLDILKINIENQNNTREIIKFLPGSYKRHIKSLNNNHMMIS